MKVYVITDIGSKKPIRDFNGDPEIYTSKSRADFEKHEGQQVRIAKLEIGEIVKC